MYTTTDTGQLREQLAVTRTALLLAVRHACAGRIDPLTQLPTRALFTAEATRRLGPGRAVALVDVDGLKPVNDRHGHHAGDRLLSVVGHRLQAWRRQQAHWGRLGGDEFAGLLEISPSDWRSALDELISGLSAPVELDADVVVRPGASVGIAEARPGLSISETLRAADAAMYRAKAQGGSRWMLYDQTTDGTLSVSPTPASRTRHATCTGTVNATQGEHA